MAKKPDYYTDEDEISFNLLNEDMMLQLIEDGDVVLPKKKVNVPKDMRWNTKVFNSELIEGLEEGESMREIANRIFPEIMLRVDLTGKTEEEIAKIIRRNIQSAIRNARTMVTGAENSGRLRSYKDLASRGVVQNKIWMSTPDDRTRPTHIDIDGEEQDINAPFTNGCQYPGDSNGPSEEVWQCRCTMRDKIIGFRRKDGSISRVGGAPEPTTMHDAQMEQEKERRKEQKKKRRSKK